MIEKPVYIGGLLADQDGTRDNENGEKQAKNPRRVGESKVHIGGELGRARGMLGSEWIDVAAEGEGWPV